MRYNKYNKGFRGRKDKYQKDEGMTVTVRQIKNKDGTVTLPKALETYVGERNI